MHLIVELIDDYFAEYPATSGGSDKVDTDKADEVIVALAKTFGELTSQQDGVIRKQLIEQLMREIMNYDAELRSEEAAMRKSQDAAQMDVGNSCWTPSISFSVAMGPARRSSAAIFPAGAGAPLSPLHA